MLIPRRRKSKPLLAPLTQHFLPSALLQEDLGSRGSLSPTEGPRFGWASYGQATLSENILSRHECGVPSSLPLPAGSRLATFPSLFPREGGIEHSGWRRPRAGGGGHAHTGAAAETCLPLAAHCSCRIWDGDVGMWKVQRANRLLCVQAMQANLTSLGYSRGHWDGGTNLEILQHYFTFFGVLCLLL